MKKSVIEVGEKMYIPTIILGLLYCLFYQYVVEFPCIFLIRLVLLLLSIFMVLTWIFSLFVRTSSKNEMKVSRRPIIKEFYLSSREIVTLVFGLYLAAYLMLSLYKISVYYNYIVVLLFGLYLGYEIATKANLYRNKK